MDALSKYQSWVACTIITNAARREHSNREPAREDCGALRIPDSSAGLNINAIPAQMHLPPVLTGLNVVATAGSMHPMAADTRPTVALPINCMDNCRGLYQ